MAAFDPARFTGDWHEVAALGRGPGARWNWQVEANGALFVSTSRDGAGQGRMIGPGRLRLSTFDAPLWVLWADADARLMVLGTPDRRFAMVLSRSAAPRADLFRSARDVLEWNGYSGVNVM